MEQNLPCFFLFAIILHPKQAAVPGAFTEVEHHLRSQALMFSHRRGPGCQVYHQVSKRTPPATDVFPLQSQFPHQTCADMCSWGILSLANDPISLSGGQTIDVFFWGVFL